MKLDYKFYDSPVVLHLWIFTDAIVKIAESIVTILSLTMYRPDWSLDLCDWYMDMCTPKQEDEE